MMGVKRFVYHFRFQLFMLLSLLIEVAYPSPTTITSCPADHYAVLNEHGDGIRSCQLCHTCPPGYGAQEPCTATQNTVCSLCPIDTFSSTMSGNESCQPCRTCGEAGVHQECSPISDTLCNKPCRTGKYYDPTADECRMCSYCFPDRPNARTVRIRACQSQGLPDDFQCSPLPALDVGDDWTPPLVIAMPDSSGLQSDRRHHAHEGGGDHILASRDFQQSSDVNSEGSGRTGAHHGHGERRHRKKDWTGGSIPTRSRTHNDELANPMSLPLKDSDRESQLPALFDITNSEDAYFKLIESDNFDEKPARSSFTSTSSPSVPESKEVSSEFEEFSYSVKSDADSEENDNNDNNQQREQGPDGPNQSQSLEGKSYHRSLSSADIGLVVGIALGCGVLSFLLTALTCHCCLVRRGKNVGPKVAVASGKAPVSAWTYVDLMPTTQPSPTVETPTMSRKITCV